MCLVFAAVFWIHDIFLWIWIWTRGSMLLTNDPNSDPDPDPAIFVTDLQDANKKLICLKKFFCFLLFECTLDKKSKRSHKTAGIKVFHTIFCFLIEGSGSGSTPLTNGSGSGRPKNIWIRGFGSGTLAVGIRK
jgi:hypothetical protein